MSHAAAAGGLARALAAATHLPAKPAAMIRHSHNQRRRTWLELPQFEAWASNAGKDGRHDRNATARFHSGDETCAAVVFFSILEQPLNRTTEQSLQPFVIFRIFLG